LSPAHHQQLPAISSPLPSPQWLTFDRLHPHPGNPPLFDREEVIEGIAQSLRSSGFDPAHALIVRPLGDDWQIISGHHRRRASERAELDRIPCWVRELDDATAYMMLVTCNTQSIDRWPASCCTSRRLPPALNTSRAALVMKVRRPECEVQPSKPSSR
jgi:hypothetical protein